MTAKRSNKRKSRRRRRGFFLLLLLAVICAAAFLCISIFFKVETITVSGDTRYSEEEVIAASGIEIGQNIFTVSKTHIQKSITAACPYVESVELVRHLPGDLEIKVSESSEVYACINSMGQITMVNADGLVLEQCASLPQYTCLLLGSDYSSYPTGEYLPEEHVSTFLTLDKLLKALEESGISGDVGYVNLSDPLDIRVMVKERILLLVGSEYELSAKLLTARTIIEDQLADDYTGTLNISVVGKAYAKEKALTEFADAQYLAILNSRIVQNVAT